MDADRWRHAEYCGLFRGCGMDGCWMPEHAITSCDCDLADLRAVLATEGDRRVIALTLDEVVAVNRSMLASDAEYGEWPASTAVRERIHDLFTADEWNAYWDADEDDDPALPAVPTQERDPEEAHDG